MRAWEWEPGNETSWSLGMRLARAGDETSRTLEMRCIMSVCWWHHFLSPCRRSHWDRMSDRQSCWLPVAGHGCGHDSLCPLYYYRWQVRPSGIYDCSTSFWLVLFFARCVNGECFTGVRCRRGVGFTICTHVCLTSCARTAKKGKLLHPPRAHQTWQLLVFPHQMLILLTDRSVDPDLTAFTADLLDVTMETMFAGDIPQIVDLLHFSIDVLGNISSRSSILSSHQVYCTML